MKPVWEETRPGKEWRTRVLDMDVTVHRYIDEPGMWYAACHDFGGRVRLVSETPEGARLEALRRLHDKAAAIVEALKGRHVR